MGLAAETPSGGHRLTFRLSSLHICRPPRVLQQQTDRLQEQAGLELMDEPATFLGFSWGSCSMFQPPVSPNANYHKLLYQKFLETFFRRRRSFGEFTTNFATGLAWNRPRWKRSSLCCCNAWRSAELWKLRWRPLCRSFRPMVSGHRTEKRLVRAEKGHQEMAS